MSSLTMPASTIQPDNYRFLQDLVYQGSGIVLEQNKQYLMEARLTAVARQHGMQTINDLCALMRATTQTAVHRQVVEAMTTNETYFFREPAHYDAIRTVLLPQLKQLRAQTQKMSFWSAASSTGQEAYSLAMLLTELGLASWNLQIVGTDLSTPILERARLARYLQIEVNRGLPAAMLLKYFRRQGLDWELNEAIRRMARFEQLDLRKPLHAFGPFDLVFCRNVLVYFDAATRRKILREIHGTLFRGGWLFLGTAESPPGMDDLFEPKAVGPAIVYVAK